MPQTNGLEWLIERCVEYELQALEAPLPGDAAQALRAEHALREHGLPLPKPGESA